MRSESLSSRKRKENVRKRNPTKMPKNKQCKSEAVSGRRGSNFKGKCGLQYIIYNMYKRLSISVKGKHLCIVFGLSWGKERES